MNFTSQADQYNAENIVIFTNQKIVGQYQANWNLHLAHSTSYVPPT